MDKPTTVEIVAAKYGERSQEQSTVELIDPVKLPEGGYGYVCDLGAFGIEAIVWLKVRDARPE